MGSIASGRHLILETSPAKIENQARMPGSPLSKNRFTDLESGTVTSRYDVGRMTFRLDGINDRFDSGPQSVADIWSYTCTSQRGEGLIVKVPPEVRCREIEKRKKSGHWYGQHCSSFTTLDDEHHNQRGNHSAYVHCRKC
jgi:hypothetical protein